MQSPRRSKDTKIINGFEGKPGQYPFTAALTEYSSGMFFCSGSIIGRRFVLTAAHCLTTVGEQNRINVILGTHDLRNYSASYQKIRSKAWVYHEQYVESSSRHDLGVILLEHEIIYNDDIREVILYHGNNTFVNKEVIGCGWGYYDDSNKASTILNCMEAVTISNEQCGSFYGGDLAENFICAQGMNQSRTCSGDSGNALVFEENYGSYTAIGVMSFGLADCKEGPVVYNRVSTYYGWIIEQMQNLSALQ
ncbi:brachyurin-like [Photinus pyralis]|uniref:brachyurin-like n=1 Tax=Photinus pyralis TaxID=7054 RepID=UPI0012676F3D|nr:brachyurin-like [Photinus pyralis]